MANLSSINGKFIVESTGTVVIPNNNVGIGTTSPNPFSWGTRHLTVQSAGTNTYAAVDIIGSGSGAGALIFGGGSGSGTATNVGRAQISALDGSDLVFYTNESNSGSSFTERMRIESDGKIQVGSDKVIWAGGYGGGLVIRQNNGTGDRLIKMVTVDSTGAIALDNVLVAKGASVGIGTDSPAQSLDITGKIRVRDGGNTTIPSIQMGASGIDGLSLPTTNTIAFITNSTERMRIDSDGSVGIGPQSNGTLADTLQVSSSTSGDGIILTGDGTASGMSSGNYRRIGFRYDDTDQSFESEIRFVVANSAAHGGEMQFVTDNSSGTKSVALTIDSSQNATFAGSIKIGGDKLSILEEATEFKFVNANVDSGYEFWTRNSGSAYVQALTISGAGNVGIGTTSPDAKLEISDSTNDNLRIGTRGGNINLFSVNDAGATAPLRLEASDFQFINGDATFSGTVTVNDVTGSSIQNTVLNLKTTTASYNAGLMFINSGNTASYNDIAGIASFVDSGSAKGNLQFWTRNSDGDNSDVATRLTINSSGNSTFAGSITCVGLSSTIASATSGYFATNTAIPANQILHVRDDVAAVATNSAGGIKISSSPGNDVFLLKRNNGGTSYFALQNSSATEFITTDMATGNVGINDSSPVTKLSINGANYVEMATFAAAAGSTAGIVTNNVGYVTGFTTSATHVNSNAALFVPVTDGIKITKAGLLHVTVTQDFISTLSSGYCSVQIRKNGTIMFYSLRTNSNNQWDMINSTGTMLVAANDEIGFYYSATDFTSMDTGSWSQYSFIWTAR